LLHAELGDRIFHCAAEHWGMARYADCGGRAPARTSFRSQSRHRSTDRFRFNDAINSTPTTRIATNPAGEITVSFFHLLRTFTLTLLLLLNGAAHALTEDWGTIATPISEETSFSFAQYDITGNFTHDYGFSLEGSAGATYEVSFTFDACRTGCGSPELTYGIYHANGSHIGNTNGTVTLSAGNYIFQVKGTGMGSGNSIDYWGSVTFSMNSSSMQMVSPVPEPSTLVLTFCGALFLAFAAAPRQTLGLIRRLVPHDVHHRLFDSRAEV